MVKSFASHVRHISAKFLAGCNQEPAQHAENCLILTAHGNGFAVNVHRGFQSIKKIT
jgi:hypothetical protein